MRKLPTLTLALVFLLAAGCSLERFERPISQVWRGMLQPVLEAPIDRPIPPEELKADVDYFVETLEDVHPDPYARIPKETFYQKVEVFKTRIQEPMTRKEFFLELAPLAATLKDAHTHALTPRRERLRYRKQGRQFFSLRVSVDSTRLFVAQDLSNAASPITTGQEIEAINGAPVDSLIQVMRRYVPSVSVPYANDKLEEGFSTDLHFVHGFEGPFDVQLARRHVQLEGVPWDTLQAREERHSVVSTGRDLSYATLDREIGLLTVNSFSMELDTFNVFLEQAFTQVRRDSVQHLIIDVRQNGGGSSVLAKALIGYITEQPFKRFHRVDWMRSRQYEQYIEKQYPSWVRLLPLWPYDSTLDEYFGTDIGEVYTRYPEEEKPPSHSLRFGGDTYVLSGVDTFSSAVIFLMTIKDYQLGTTVGEETGAAACHFGEVYPYFLPHSKLAMFTSSKYFVRPSGECGPGGLEPDVYVRQAAGDSVDAVLRRTKALIMSSD